MISTGRQHSPRYYQILAQFNLAQSRRQFWMQSFLVAVGAEVIGISAFLAVLRDYRHVAEEFLGYLYFLWPLHLLVVLLLMVSAFAWLTHQGRCRDLARLRHAEESSR